jgi:hypothetical protein
MRKTYVTNERDMVGYAYLPKWLDFNEKPPRSFEVVWIDRKGKPFMKSTASTAIVSPVTKEVADIIRSVKYD